MPWRRRVVVLVCVALSAAGLSTVVGGSRAEAQTPTGRIDAVSAAADGSYTVPYDWPLRPAGVGPGRTFRLLFITSTSSTATSTDIATYNGRVVARARVGHESVRPFAEAFRVLGSTATVDARDNTNTNTNTSGTVDSPVFFLNGAKVADDLADFYDGTWDVSARPADRDESGRQISETGTITVRTGSSDDGTADTRSMGAATATTSSWSTTSSSPFSNGTALSSWSRRLYGLSPVFRVSTDPSQTGTVMVVAEGGNAMLSVKLSAAPSANVSVAVARQSGSSDVTFAPNSLTFTTSNWNTAQSVTVSAAEDSGDSNHDDSAVLRLTATGYSMADVPVRAADDEASPTVGLSLPTVEGLVRVNGARPFDEAADSDNDSNTAESMVFNVSADSAPSANLVVCVRVKEWVGERVASSDEGVKTVTISSGATSATLSVPYANDEVDTVSSVVTAEVLARGAPGCTGAGAGYEVSAANRFDTARIVDDEATTVSLELTGADAIVEGGAPTEFTVSLGRDLVAGEVVEFPLQMRIAGNNEPTIAAKSGDGLNAGVTVRDVNTTDNDHVVAFTGPAAHTATLTLAAAASSITGRSHEGWKVIAGDSSDSRWSARGLVVRIDGGVTVDSDADEVDVRVYQLAHVGAVTATLTADTNTSSVVLQDSYGAQLVSEGAAAVGRVKVTLSLSTATALVHGQSFAVPLSTVAVRGDARGWRQAGHSLHVGTATAGGVTLGTDVALTLDGTPTGVTLTGGATNTPKLEFEGGATEATLVVTALANSSRFGADRLFAVGLGTAQDLTLVTAVTAAPAPGSAAFPHLVLRDDDRQAADVRVHDVRYLKWTVPDDYTVWFNDNGTIKYRWKYIEPADTTANYHYDRALNLWGSELDYRVVFLRPPAAETTLTVTASAASKVQFSRRQAGPYTTSLTVTVEPDDPANPNRCENPGTGKWSGDQSWRCTIRIWVKPLNNANAADCVTVTHRTTTANSGYNGVLGAANDMQIRLHKHGAHLFPIAAGGPPASCRYPTPVPAKAGGFNWSAQPTSAGYAEYQACITRVNCQPATDSERENYGRGNIRQPDDHVPDLQMTLDE